MIKQICILTKSYKHGGYCVAGIDMKTYQWIRLANSVDLNDDEIKKEQMFVDGKTIECFDVYELDFIKQAPTSCQTENWLLNSKVKPKYIRTISLEELLNIIHIDKDKNFILNKDVLLTTNEISQMKRSLFIYCVKDLKIDASQYENFGEIKFKYKCSFQYNNILYTNISLTDPKYRDVEKNDLCLPDALILASLPCIPYKDDLYYKFVAKIIPINEDAASYIENSIDKKRISIKQEGFFYSVYDNDALILNKYFGYKLYGSNRLKTGFPVKGASRIIEKIKTLQMDYEILNGSGELKECQTFPDNHYEIIHEPRVPSKTEENEQNITSHKNKLQIYIDALHGLSKGCNIFTGEVINNLDDELKTLCAEMADYLNKKL